MIKFRHRGLVAVLLLNVFLLGGIAAPFAHLFYMAVSDTFMPMTEMGHGKVHSDEHDAMTVGENDSFGDAPVVADAGEDFFVCEYADLFVTPVTALLVGSPSVATVEQQPVITHVLQRAKFFNGLTVLSVRGPPLNSCLT